MTYHAYAYTRASGSNLSNQLYGTEQCALRQMLETFTHVSIREHALPTQPTFDNSQKGAVHSATGRPGSEWLVVAIADRPAAYLVMTVVTPLSGRMMGLLAWSTHLNVIDAPPKRTPGMFWVTFWVTNSNSFPIPEQN
uniref:Uncharacterized protein n=1 Tax=Ralstonia solanacearum TaxID=305 RepID=A0A0S4TL48_RALSL|nr:protein of unknown function [Ralstonia solanacearum]